MSRDGFRIGRLGRRLVADWLTERGYDTDVERSAPGSGTIVAFHENGSVLVRVRTSVAPHVPAGLRPDELEDVASSAERLRCEPWEARVVIDDEGGLVGDILWRLLGS